MRDKSKLQDANLLVMDGSVFEDLINKAKITRGESRVIKRANHDDVSLEGHSFDEVVDIIKEAFVWCKDCDDVFRLIERNVGFILKLNILSLLSELGNQYLSKIFLSMGLLTQDEALIILKRYKYDQFLCEEALLCFWGIDPGFQEKLFSILRDQNPKVLKILERFPPEFNPRTIHCLPKKDLHPIKSVEETKREFFRLRIFLNDLFAQKRMCVVN